MVQIPSSANEAVTQNKLSLQMSHIGGLQFHIQHIYMHLFSDHSR